MASEVEVGILLQPYFYFDDGILTKKKHPLLFVHSIVDPSLFLMQNTDRVESLRTIFKKRIQTNA